MEFVMGSLSIRRLKRKFNSKRFKGDRNALSRKALRAWARSASRFKARARKAL